MSFTLHSCTPHDGLSLASITISALWTDPSWAQMWRSKTQVYVVSQSIRRFPHTLLQDPLHRRHQKAISAETGAIVGYARWSLPESLADADGVWPQGKVVDDLSMEEKVAAEREFNNADWEFDHSFDVLDEKFDEVKESLMQGREYVLLDLLVVDPDYWRQGVGKMLIEGGLREMDRAGLDVFVHGEKAGLTLYRKMEFEILEEVVLDDSEFGGDGEYGAYFLARKCRQEDQYQNHVPGARNSTKSTTLEGFSGLHELLPDKVHGPLAGVPK